MKKLMLLLILFTLSAVMAAQIRIPAGTIIPVELNSSINAKKCKPGQTITARVAQDVPLYNGARIKAGSRVLGEIITVTQAENSQPATVGLRFDRVDVSGHVTPITTDLRALAAPLEVEFAQLQVSGDDRGSTPLWSQTTTLIGGDVAYREEGIVERGSDTVGTTVYAGAWGVLSHISPDPDEKCRGALGGNDNPQALWVFSHDACGAYGSEAVIRTAGRSSPEGKILLASTQGNLNIRSGSALLLRINTASDGLPQNEVVSK
jgi:hypothetical protein